MSVLTFSFGLRPSKVQHRHLNHILRAQCDLYNAALQERRDAWSKNKIFISFNDQTKSLTEIRDFDENYGSYAYNISKWTLKRLDDAFKGFFARVKKGTKAGFPRFKSLNRWESFGFHQHGGLQFKNGKLYIKGISTGIKVRQHRTIPVGSMLKSATFSKRNNCWTVNLTYDVPVESFTFKSKTFLGIDIGVEHLATTSEGEHFENARPFKKSRKALRKAARALARCRLGSRRRRKARARLAKCSRSIRNARTNHLHHVANAIVSRASVIVVEKLKIRNMTRSAKGTLAEPGSNVRQKAGLNRSMQDASPGRLIAMIAYKAEKAGGMMIKVNPKDTSQNCSGCDFKVRKTLRDRQHVCPECGLTLHRDYNAAINIRKRGVTAFEAARGLGEANVAKYRMRSPVKALSLTA